MAFYANIPNKKISVYNNYLEINVLVLLMLVLKSFIKTKC